jgi:endonuclease/exonuclease/phosphatase family metal-dependent hydrolase
VDPEALNAREPTATCVAVWNLRWATPRSKRGRLCQEVLAEADADVAVLTETVAAIAPADGHVITSRDDYGYGVQPHRRKVVLWSRHPWQEVDELGSPDLPPGRFVAGTTDTPSGPVRVVGVCVPWRDAHVRTGRRDRRPWEDHLAYLDALRRVVAPWLDQPLLVAGDLNQRIPRRRQPRHVYERLTRLVDDNLVAVTAGTVPGIDQPLIDHVLASPHVVARAVRGWSRVHSDGTTLSDHDGIRVVFNKAADYGCHCRHAPVLETHRAAARHRVGLERVSVFDPSDRLA